MRNIIASIVSGFLFLGCAAKPVVRPDSAATTGAPKTPAPASSKGEALQANASFDLEPRPIYYELDSARLDEPSQRSLSELGEALRNAPNATVRISGHTCELGTTEYNLVLGLRRASEARDYLVRLGVEPERIDIASFGEEQPALTGKDDSQLRKNRRSEFAIGSVRQGPSVQKKVSGVKTAAAQLP